MKRIVEKNHYLRTGAVWLWGIAALLVVPYSALYAQPSAPPPGAPDAVFPTEARFVPNQLLVQFQSGAGKAERADARDQVGAKLEERITTAPMRAEGRGELELVSVPPGIAIAGAIRTLKKHPAVEFAEPNWIYYHQSTSIDPYYTNGSLWGMYGDGTSPANPYGSQAGEAWAAAWAAGCTGSGTVYVGIIDEGIQFSHPDLDGQVWTNPDDLADGIDNDGNGYVDDVHGWDFAGGNNGIYDGGASGKKDDHGTHVSGTIGAKANTSGVAGVNWSVTLISAKFLGSGGGTTANAIKALNYITDLKSGHGLNIVATNNSWGGGGYSQALLDAINRGGDVGILFVAAAGNGGFDGKGDNNDTTQNYPSNYQCTSNGKAWDCIIAVAAITSTGAKASFSNYGLTSVDLGAPGVGIWSTTALNTYSSYSGTSMATPHVSGAAALYASTHPGASAAEIKAAILNGTVATSSLSGKTVTGGRLNVSGFCGP